MSKAIEKLLDFEDKKITIVEVDGIAWVPVKPVCEALGISYKHQHETIKADEILGQLSRIHRTVGADDKSREMFCLPEKYVYGWLFSIRSDSPDLRVYKMKCYDVLYHYFHGLTKAIVTNVNRELEINRRVEELQQEMTDSKQYTEIISLKKEKSALGKKRKQLEINAALGIVEFEFPEDELNSEN